MLNSEHFISWVSSCTLDNHQHVVLTETASLKVPHNVTIHIQQITLAQQYNKSIVLLVIRFGRGLPCKQEHPSKAVSLGRRRTEDCCNSTAIGGVLGGEL